jgi:hypothetical protein
VREYEIGSEAWMRERVAQGLDPSESDRPPEHHLLRLDVEFADSDYATGTAADGSRASSSAAWFRSM